MEKVSRLYQHRTDGGVTYLCSSKVTGTAEQGDLQKSKIIVRIYPKKRSCDKVYAEIIRNEN